MSPNGQPQLCSTLQQLQECSGQRVTLRGIYHQIDIRQRRKSANRPSGYVAIQLGDGTEVAIEPSWSLEAIRTPAERALFDGKLVDVVGIVHKETPRPTEQVAYVMGPCLSPVEEISFVAQEPST